MPFVADRGTIRYRQAVKAGLQGIAPWDRPAPSAGQEHNKSA
ncbi:hypothetical protein [Carnimonas nigrificans]|nr:hypothetical protein [Carnimonas nigrificans]